MNALIVSNLDMFLALVGSMVLGGLLGAERTFAGKTAGMRTYALVAMGSTMFILVSRIVSANLVGVVNFDPMRVAAQIITGVGFLGGGMIIFHDAKLTGLTTSAGLWMSAGIGVGMGFNLYLLSVMATTLTLIVFTLMWYLEQYFGFPKK